MVQDAPSANRSFSRQGAVAGPRLGAAVSAARARADGLCLAFVLAFAAATVAVMWYVAFGRLQDFQANAYDLGLFDQVVFNTSRGRPFETTLLPYSFAGEHTQPILFAFAPAYWLNAGPMFLVATQMAVAALAAVPLFFLARRSGLPAGPSLAAAVAYLANPYLHRALLFDFHPEAMAALPMFLGAWAVVAGRRLLSVGAALSLLLFKEDAVFMALALAALMWACGNRREAIASAGTAVAVTLLTVLVVMPHYRGGEDSLLTDRYAYLLPWREDAGMARGLVFAPARALERLAEPRVAATAAVFIAATGLAGIFRPQLLVFVLPGVALALLSNHAPQRDLQMHYAVELVPVAMMAAVFGAVRLRRAVGSPFVAGTLLGPTVLALILLDPVGEVRGGPAPTEAHRQAVAAALNLIPGEEGVSVSAQSSLVPRLSQRRAVYEFPAGHDSDWIIVDRYGARSSQSLAAGFDTRLQEVRNDAELVFSRDGVEVFSNR